MTDDCASLQGLGRDRDWCPRRRLHPVAPPLRTRLLVAPSVQMRRADVQRRCPSYVVSFPRHAAGHDRAALGVHLISVDRSSGSPSDPRGRAVWLPVVRTTSYVLRPGLHLDSAGAVLDQAGLKIHEVPEIAS